VAEGPLDSGPKELLHLLGREGEMKPGVSEREKEE
jgi:hypothetical protein